MPTGHPDVTLLGTLRPSLFDHQSGLSAWDLIPVHFFNGQLSRLGLDELDESEVFLHENVNDFPVLSEYFDDIFLLYRVVESSDVDSWMHREVLLVEVWSVFSTLRFRELRDYSLAVEAPSI